ncbi:hypothetical protein EJB05_28093, partial [Eragrostis curvula]
MSSFLPWRARRRQRTQRGGGFTTATTEGSRPAKAACYGPVPCIADDYSSSKLSMRSRSNRGEVAF